MPWLDDAREFLTTDVVIHAIADGVKNRFAAFTLFWLIRINCIRPQCDHYYADCCSFQLHALHDRQVHVYLEFPHEQVSILLVAWY